MPSKTHTATDSRQYLDEHRQPRRAARHGSGARHCRRRARAPTRRAGRGCQRRGHVRLPTRPHLPPSCPSAAADAMATSQVRKDGVHDGARGAAGGRAALRAMTGNAKMMSAGLAFAWWLVVVLEPPSKGYGRSGLSVLSGLPAAARPAAAATRRHVAVKRVRIRSTEHNGIAHEKKEGKSYVEPTYRRDPGLALPSSSVSVCTHKPTPCHVGTEYAVDVDPLANPKSQEL